MALARNIRSLRSSPSSRFHTARPDITRRPLPNPTYPKIWAKQIAGVAFQEGAGRNGNAAQQQRGEDEAGSAPLLAPNELFNSFTESPIPEIRQRAALIRQHAYCPHPEHQPTRVTDRSSMLQNKPELGLGSTPPAHAQFECPDCGIPIYCSKEHWMDDYEAHLDICDVLRQINEDDHDLRSGREFPEFEYAGPQMEEALVNMTNWDTFLYTRDFAAINDDRGMRQATRLLTYPITIGSILHELSPYNVRPGGRLTAEGLKSLSGVS